MQARGLQRLRPLGRAGVAEGVERGGKGMAGRAQPSQSCLQNWLHHCHSLPSNLGTRMAPMEAAERPPDGKSAALNPGSLQEMNRC